MLLHGKNEKNIALQAARNGQPLPDFIRNAPELLPGLEFYLNAFSELSTERPGGFGAVYPIPISKMREYCSYNELGKEETEDFIFLIKRLDTNHIDKVNKKLQAQNKNGKSS